MCHPPPSTLHSPPSTLHPPPSTLPQLSCVIHNIGDNAAGWTVPGNAGASFCCKHRGVVVDLGGGETGCAYDTCGGTTTATTGGVVQHGTPTCFARYAPPPISLLHGELIAWRRRRLDHLPIC